MLRCPDGDNGDDDNDNDPGPGCPSKNPPKLWRRPKYSGQCRIRMMTINTADANALVSLAKSQDMRTMKVFPKGSL